MSVDRPVVTDTAPGHHVGVRFSNIVVGIDGDQGSVDAATWAVGRLAPNGHVTLVHVSPQPDPEAADSRRDVAASLDAAAPTGSVRADELVGHDVADTLLSTATDRGADLLVLGSRTPSAWHLRNVSRPAARIHRARQLPFAVVRPGATGEVSTTWVGVDGSEGSWDLLRWVDDHTDTVDDLAVIWVLDRSMSETAEMPVRDYDVLRRAVHAYMTQEIASIFGPRADRVRIIVELGHAAKHLAEDRTPEDLVIIGHDHHSVLERAVGTSVSLQLLNRCDATMIVAGRTDASKFERDRLPGRTL
jgi:nucleotide-binding universal stress UspA family protein